MISSLADYTPISKLPRNGEGFDPVAELCSLTFLPERSDKRRGDPGGLKSEAGARRVCTD